MTNQLLSDCTDGRPVYALRAQADKITINYPGNNSNAPQPKHFVPFLMGIVTGIIVVMYAK